MKCPYGLCILSSVILADILQRSDSSSAFPDPVYFYIRIGPRTVLCIQAKHKPLTASYKVLTSIPVISVNECGIIDGLTIVLSLLVQHTTSML